MTYLAALTALSLLGVALYGCAYTGLGSAPRGERLARMERSPQRGAGVFRNSVETTVMLPGSHLRTFGEFLFGGRPVRRPDAPLPVVPLRKASFAPPPSGGLRLTWLGHSTMLIEIDGHVVLTDPVLGSRASPFGWAGPKRFSPAPLAAEELPPIDAVVISHDHYDHLDRATVMALADRPVRFVVPLGVGAHLEGWGIARDRIVELDWWEEARIQEGLRLVAAPARHFSGRGARDRNRTLWASFAVVGNRHRVYFGGDSGSFPGHAEIGAKLGPFDVALLDVGAYGAAWPQVHMTPEEGVSAHLSLRGKLLVPIHWATFSLSTIGWTEPAERLLEAAAEAGVRLAIPRPGGMVTPGEEEPLTRWWPELPWRAVEPQPPSRKTAAARSGGGTR